MSLNRREFLAASGAGGFWIAGAARGFGQSASPNAKLNVGLVGVSGMRGKSHLDACASQTIAAICDVDEAHLGAVAQQHPKAARYADFREMLEKEKGLDAVLITTPDHTHAPAAMMAMKLGRHVYVEKPLAHTVYEARVLRETAAARKVATQMGTQTHAGSNYRRVVELVRAGAIGRVQQVHTFLGGSRWHADGLPAASDRPPTLNWDLWLGPAAERPFSKAYHPAGGWRRYWNFGGGDLADMACHHVDLPFWALGLKSPLTVEAKGPPVDPEGAPIWAEVTWTFADPAVTLTWYHGDRLPAKLKELGWEKKWRSGNLFVGEKGCLLANYGDHKLLPEETYADYTPPAPSIPPSAGHHAEWFEACRGGAPALCNFDYAGALTECVLLGNVAYRSGKRIEWDAAAMKAKNCPEADAFLRREYRKGWTL